MKRRNFLSTFFVMLFAAVAGLPRTAEAGPANPRLDIAELLLVLKTCRRHEAFIVPDKGTLTLIIDPTLISMDDRHSLMVIGWIELPDGFMRRVKK